MLSSRTRRCATAATLALTVFAGFTATAGAATNDPATIITFEVTAAGNTTMAFEAATVPTDEATNLAAYNRMLVLADGARLRCAGTVSQIDLFGPGAPVPVIGQLYPPNTPGALSAIPNIEGTGVCDTPAAAPMPEAVSEAADTAPPATVTAPPAVPEAELIPAIATSRVVSAHSDALPNTGADTPTAVAIAVLLIAGGFSLVGVGRRGR